MDFRSVDLRDAVVYFFRVEPGIRNMAEAARLLGVPSPKASGDAFRYLRADHASAMPFILEELRDLLTKLEAGQDVPWSEDRLELLSEELLSAPDPQAEEFLLEQVKVLANDPALETDLGCMPFEPSSRAIFCATYMKMLAADEMDIQKAIAWLRDAMPSLRPGALAQITAMLVFSGLIEPREVSAWSPVGSSADGLALGLYLVGRHRESMKGGDRDAVAIYQIALDLTNWTWLQCAIAERLSVHWSHRWQQFLLGLRRSHGLLRPGMSLARVTARCAETLLHTDPETPEAIWLDELLFHEGQGEPRDIPRLVGYLSSKDARYRLGAMRALRRMKVPSRLEHLHALKGCRSLEAIELLVDALEPRDAQLGAEAHAMLVRATKRSHKPNAWEWRRWLSEQKKENLSR